MFSEWTFPNNDAMLHWKDYILPSYWKTILWAVRITTSSGGLRIDLKWLNTVTRKHWRIKPTNKVFLNIIQLFSLHGESVTRTSTVDINMKNELLSH